MLINFEYGSWRCWADFGNHAKTSYSYTLMRKQPGMTTSPGCVLLRLEVPFALPFGLRPLLYLCTISLLPRSDVARNLLVFHDLNSQLTTPVTAKHHQVKTKIFSPVMYESKLA